MNCTQPHFRIHEEFWRTWTG